MILDEVIGILVLGIVCLKLIGAVSEAVIQVIAVSNSNALLLGHLDEEVQVNALAVVGGQEAVNRTEAVAGGAGFKTCNSGVDFGLAFLGQSVACLDSSVIEDGQIGQLNKSLLADVVMPGHLTVAEEVDLLIQRSGSVQNVAGHIAVLGVEAVVGIVVDAVVIVIVLSGEYLVPPISTAVVEV